LLFANYRTVFKYSIQNHKNACRFILNNIPVFADNSFPQYASSPARKHVQLLIALNGIIKTNFRMNHPVLLWRLQSNKRMHRTCSSNKWQERIKPFVENL